MTRLAIVTGASSGIGAGIARFLASRSYEVVLVARRLDLLEQLKRQISRHGGTAHVCQADLLDDEQVNALVPKVVADFGAPEVLVNSAGVVVTGEISQLEKNSWDACLTLNLRTPAMLCAAVLPGMIAKKNGVIINICSEAGVGVYAGTGAYTVSKHGLRVLTQLIQDENQESGIKAWAICPGDVATERTLAMEGNHSRYLTVDDIVQVIDLLMAQSKNVKMGPEILIRTTLDPNESD